MDILAEVMEQIRPLNEALTEKARLAHALRKLIVHAEIAIEGWSGSRDVYAPMMGLTAAILEAKEALK